MASGPSAQGGSSGGSASTGLSGDWGQRMGSSLLPPAKASAPSPCLRVLDAGWREKPQAPFPDGIGACGFVFLPIYICRRDHTATANAPAPRKLPNGNS